MAPLGQQVSASLPPRGGSSTPGSGEGKATPCFQSSREEDGTGGPGQSASGRSRQVAAAPAKRSRWEADDDGNSDEGHGEGADQFEQQAVEARVRAAAKAARQRAKASQRQRHEASRPPESAARTQGGQGVHGSNCCESPDANQCEADRPGHDTLRASPSSPPARQMQPPVPLRSWHPQLRSCRSIHCYERLNHIEEGSYGVVFRAREKASGDIVAIKKLKMDQEQNGFPITSLREIRTLMEGAHPNIVRVREIVVGDTLTQIFIVMDFIEHDLKTLLSMQKMPFLASETKTLLRQLLSALSLLHQNWIIHRDLKTSNLLMNNRGQIKLADFGLARMYGEPRSNDMTKLVVTLWYRAPELLLGADTYDVAIDMWSVGCIFAELITKEPLFPGKNEADQITKIFRLLGQPTEDSWPGFGTLPLAKNLQKQVAQPFSVIRQKFRHSTDKCLDLLQRLLTYDPARRITADEALKHPYFSESPPPAHPDTFGTFPSVAAGEKRRYSEASPDAPQRLADQKLAYQLEMDI